MSNFSEYEKLSIEELEKLLEETEAKLVTPSFEKVVVGGTTILKLVSFAEENWETASGRVYGLINDGEARVSTCALVPSAKHNSEEAAASVRKFVEEMESAMQRQGEVVGPLGLFTCTFLNSWVSLPEVRQLATMQALQPSAFLLVLDSGCCLLGDLSLRAYQLTPAFLEFARQSDVSQEAISRAGLQLHDLLREVPVELRLTPMERALAQTSLSSLHAFGALELSQQAYLRQGLGTVLERVDKYSLEQKSFQFLQRKARRTAHEVSSSAEAEPTAQQQEDMTPPSRLTSVMLAAQINQLAGHLNQFCEESVAKLDMLVPPAPTQN